MSIFQPPGIALGQADAAYTTAVSVKDRRFAGGAKADTVNYTSAVVSAGNATLTRLSGTFGAEVVAGKKVIVPGAGAAGADLTTTVVSRASDGSSVALGDVAGTGVSGVTASIGTDDTAAFDAARAASLAVMVPAGHYTYDGAGLLASGLSLRGAGRKATRVHLGTGRSLVTATGGVISLSVRDIGFDRGFGAIRFTASTASVQSKLVVADCDHDGYTHAAISSLSVDQPYWHIARNQFTAASDVNTFGISINGDNAQSVIEGNDFLRNAVHIKLGGNGGAACRVERNDFLRFGAYTTAPRIDLWISGFPAGSVLSRGLTVAANKFSVENLSANDFRVLVAAANPASGTDAATRLPLLTDAADLKFQAAVFSSNICAGQGVSAPAFLTLGVDSVSGVRITDLVYAGTIGVNVVRYLFAPTEDTQTSTNTIGQIVSADLAVNGDWSGFRYVSHPGHWVTEDRRAGFGDPEAALVFPGAGDPVDYTLLRATAVSTYSLITTATMTPTTDCYGGTDAATVTIAAADDGIVTSLPNGSIVAGIPMFIEFDAKTGGGAPATGVGLGVRRDGFTLWRRQVRIGATWRRYRVLFSPPAGTTANQLVLSTGSSTGTFTVGRIRVYQAGEPINVDGWTPGLRNQGDAVVSGTGRTMGFYGAAGSVKPTVTGAKGGNAAVASLVTALANLGLVVDSTTT